MHINKDKAMGDFHPAGVGATMSKKDATGKFSEFFARDSAVNLQ